VQWCAYHGCRFSGTGANCKYIDRIRVRIFLASKTTIVIICPYFYDFKCILAWKGFETKLPFSKYPFPTKSFWTCQLWILTNIRYVRLRCGGRFLQVQLLFYKLRLYSMFYHCYNDLMGIILYWHNNNDRMGIIHHCYNYNDLIVIMSLLT